MSQNRFGRYKIEQQVGRGGMATVYRAHDPRFDRRVALKILPQNLSQDSTFSKRFDQEARTSARLEHYAIVPVYDYGEQDKRPFLVMRLMQGGSLEPRMQQPLELPFIQSTLKRVADALDIAHENYVIHRDVKPANILFDDRDQAYLGDFGIVRLTETTQTQTVLGTPFYMSPEQGLGLTMDGRADVYSLGVVLFEMLTGERPYQGSNPATIIYQHVHAPIPSAQALNADLPTAIDKVIKKALAKKPEKRFETAGELAAAFAKASQSQNGLTIPIFQFPRLRYAVLAVLLLFVLLLFALPNWVSNNQTIAEPAENETNTLLPEAEQPRVSNSVQVLITQTNTPQPTAVPSATAAELAAMAEQAEATSTLANTPTPRPPTTTPMAEIFATLTSTPTESSSATTAAVILRGNLLTNSSFEQDLAGWQFERDLSDEWGDPEVAIASDVVADGARALKVSTAFKAISFRLYQRVRLQPGNYHFRIIITPNLFDSNSDVLAQQFLAVHQLYLGGPLNNDRLSQFTLDVANGICYPFSVSQAQDLRVGIAVQSRFPISSSAFFLDDASLEAGGC